MSQSRPNETQVAVAAPTSAQPSRQDESAQEKDKVLATAKVDLQGNTVSGNAAKADVAAWGKFFSGNSSDSKVTIDNNSRANNVVSTTICNIL